MEKIGIFEVHPAAQLFPEMTREELVVLAASLKANGLQKPIAFCRGQLLDGRNRARAASMAGIPLDQLSRIDLPEEVDPYRYAYAANCDRLDYSSADKTALWIRVLKESGELDTRKRAAKAKGDKKRSEATAKQHAAKAGENVVEYHDDTSPEDDSVAAGIAKETGASKPTVNRRLAEMEAGKQTRMAKKKRPKTSLELVTAKPRGKNKLKGLLRSLPGLAAYLRKHLPRERLAELARLLMAEVKAA